MKKTLAACATAGAMLLLAVPAGAASPPNGNGLETFSATCGGEPATITTGGGAAFYVGGQKYVLTSFSGTFTPSDGSAPQSFTKEYGNRTGRSGTPITCTGSETSEEGTFSFEATGASSK